MKFVIVFLAFAMIASAFALPSPVEDEEQHNEGGIVSRVRRVTCDLLSPSTPWGSLNHAACAAHCLALRKGFRGGRCINGVCNCRK